MQLGSNLFGCRGRPRAAILDEGGGQTVHLGETGERVVTSHLQSRPQVLKIVVEVGGCLSNFS